MNKQKKLGVYCRISGDKKKRTDYSIEEQKNQGYKLAEQHNWNVKEYIDEGKSGTLLKGELLKLISDIKLGELHAIYAYDQSRLERASNIWSLIQAECINNHVDIYFFDKKQDLEDPQAKFLSNILSLINNFYTEIASQKLKATYKSKILQGKTHGKLPYGITRDESNNYIINKQEAVIVQEIFRLANQGYGTLKIANMLNEKGFENRAKTVWQNSTVAGILKNEIYKGKKISISNSDVLNEKISFDLPFQIIDSKLFDSVNERMKANEPKTKKSKYLYLLNELIICPYCNSFVTGRFRERDRAYKCIKFHKHLAHLTCDNAFGVSLPKLDTFIMKLLFETDILTETVLQSLKSNRKIEDLNEELAKLRIRLKDQEQKQNIVYQLLLELGSDHLKQEYQIETNTLKQLVAKIDDIQFELNDLKSSKQEKNIIDAIEYFKRDYEFSKVKEYVNSIIDYIKIYQNNDKSIYIIIVKLKFFKYELIYQTDKNLFEYHLLSYKDENTRKEFVSYFNHFFGSNLDKKFNKILDIQEGFDYQYNEDSEAAEKDFYDYVEHLREVFREEDFYRYYSVRFTKDDLIHFNDPIYKRHQEL